MRIFLDLSGQAEEYLRVIFQKISEHAGRNLTNDEMTKIVIGVIEKGAELKWGEINGIAEEDLEDLEGTGENFWYTLFGDVIEIKSV
ncbi:MAG: hypothetical protein FJZ04_01400 [Candidatus Moranbacteria bacterium]|nr:hypothetical protein [Candidatus Moranbacteria bacterium]